jgi:hypothetical protein
VAKVDQIVGKTLQMGDAGFERYIDELVEECARFIQLVARLRQLPEGESPRRDELETEFFGSLAHLKEHTASLSEWVDQLIEALPDEE